ncbi:FAD-dependent oxidoreductase [Lentzea jiangxiensis]|uniref:2-polyprenyl-6-methoxyphenol hydroxylase n=1 Tax=Lentzea jiangxiensis TaxID=641025 RepID=A0A1H0X3J2_9PSEU|nr:NAD(P)-binding protein [Lentzea jiangxiensis]SDP97528.1 2-polyprenyl-6-methoxyphenol hydroxylase [Lentzea jiangxiensis]
MPNPSARIFERLSTVEAPFAPQRHFAVAHVLGGGISGLLAARVLADHADRVVIVESDGADAGSAGEARPGVPQGYQVHALLPGGQQQLERFYPGLVAEALGAGAVWCDPDRFIDHVDGVAQVTTPNAAVMSSTRPFLELLIRRRTLALPNVRLVNGKAIGLRYTGDEVAAVRYRTGTGEIVASTDFVVDATGRSSRVGDWLAEGGWAAPELERLQVDIRYLTARFERSAAWTGPLTGICRRSPGQAPAEPLRGAAATAVEGGLWSVMVHHEGITAADFVEHCRALPPIFQEAVSGRMVGEVVPYRHPDNRWRHFESVQRFPARLVVVGDAVASFNPVYGQGMSSASLHASCLSEFLRSGPDFTDHARHFFELQKVVVEAAWITSSTGDRAGRNREVRQVLIAALRDVPIGTAVRAVTFLMAHPSTLADPDLVSRAMRVNGTRAQSSV